MLYCMYIVYTLCKQPVKCINNMYRQYFQVKHGAKWNIDCPTPESVIKQFKDLVGKNNFKLCMYTFKQ